MAQLVKNPPAMWETWVRSLHWEDPREEGMATHSRILEGESPWIEVPGGLQSVEPQRVGYDWVMKHCIISSSKRLSPVTLDHHHTVIVPYFILLLSAQHSTCVKCLLHVHVNSVGSKTFLPCCVHCSIPSSTSMTSTQSCSVSISWLAFCITLSLRSSCHRSRNLGSSPQCADPDTTQTLPLFAKNKH